MKNVKKPQENKQTKKDYLKEKDNLQIFTFKECLRQLLFFLSERLKTN